MPERVLSEDGAIVFTRADIEQGRQVWQSIGGHQLGSRSADFMQQPIIDLLVWMRVPGDVIFSVGAPALAWFVLRLWVGLRRVVEAVLPPGSETARP